MNWQNGERNQNAGSCPYAVPVGRFRIERVNAFLFERRHDVGADHRNGGVKAVLQARQANFRRLANKILSIMTRSCGARPRQSWRFAANEKCNPCDETAGPSRPSLQS
jgi:hypothetical protein